MNRTIVVDHFESSLNKFGNLILLKPWNVFDRKLANSHGIHPKLPLTDTHSVTCGHTGFVFFYKFLLRSKGTKVSTKLTVATYEQASAGVDIF